MDYADLLSRAWRIVWDHKYLVVLGVLAALGGGGTPSSGSNYRVSDQEVEGAFGQLPSFDRFEPWLGLAIAAIVVIAGLLIVVGLVIWAVSQIARGGLIAGVDLIETGQASSFAIAWEAGWHRGMRLIGIGLVPLIPALVLMVSGLVVGSMFLGLGALFQGGVAIRTAGFGAVGVFLALLCAMAPILLVLALLTPLAYRACMLENTGVWYSYRRGWQVLTGNLGSALIIFILQLAIHIILFVVLFVPGLIMTVCCLLWPVLLAIQGAIAAYFSTVWTLAWREWTAAPAATTA